MTCENPNDTFVIRPVTCEDVGTTKDGPGGAANTVLPALTPESASEASVKVDHQSVDWSTRVRRAALVAVEIAAIRREADDRVFRYFLCSAIAHGLTVAEVAAAAHIDAAEVHRLTDPWAA